MDTINILSIDPGTNMGITIYTVSVPDLKIINIVGTTINLAVRSPLNTEHSNLLLRIQIIDNYLSRLMDSYQPHILAMEAAFVNARFPKSVMYLSQYIAAIELAVTRANPHLRVFNYPPKLVKKAVGAGGKADKDDMTVAMSNIPEVAKYLDLTTLSEHQIDSTAIGYVCLQELRECPVLLLTI